MEGMKKWICPECNKETDKVFDYCSEECKNVAKLSGIEAAKEFTRINQERRSKPATIGDIEDAFERNGCNCCK